MIIENKSADLLKFLKTLYAGCDASSSYVYLQQYSDVDKTKPTTPKPIALSDLYAQAEKGALPAKENFSLCITPNVFADSEATRKNNTVSHITSVFVDIDIDLTTRQLSEKFKELGAKPQIINGRLNQVGNDQKHYRYHLYYLFDTPVENTEENKQKLDAIKKRLIDFYRADKSVKNEKAVMRLPFTKHFKTSNERNTYYATLYTDADRITLDDLFTICTATERSEQPQSITTATDDSGETSEAAILHLIKSVYRDAEPVGAGQGRSRELFLLGVNCFSWGLDIKTALDLGQWLNEHLFTEPEDDETIRHQIESAYRYHRGEFGEYRNDLAGCKTEAAQTRFAQKQKLYYRVFHSLKNYVYVFAGERLINTATGTEYTTLQQINNYIAHATQSKIRLDEILQRRLVTVCDKMTFHPTRPRLYRHEGLVYYNRFDETTLPEMPDNVNEKAVDIFCEHLRYLTNTEYEYNAVLNYFAYCVQKPAEKLPYALCIVSDHEGTGRSVLSKILFDKIYGAYTANVENNDLDSGFNEYMADTLMVFVHELAQGDSYSIMNKLKNKITEDKFTINEKYARKYTVQTMCNFVFFSNKINALRVAKQDRRLLVIHNKKEPLEQSYYDTLVETFKEHYDSIYSFLMNKDLSAFNPHARPEITEGKKLMIEQSKTELDLYLQNLLDERTGVFASNVFTIEQIIQYCDDNSPQALRYKISHKRVRQFLMEHGCPSRFVQKRVKGERVRKTYYALPDFDLDSVDVDSLTLGSTARNVAGSDKKEFNF